MIGGGTTEIVGLPAGKFLTAGALASGISRDCGAWLVGSSCPEDVAESEGLSLVSS